MANELLNRLTADVKTAMKAGDKDRLQVLRMLVAGLKEEQHQVGTESLDEDAELTVMRRAVKTRRETIEQAEQSGRPEIAAREQAEIEIIEAYLPATLSGDALQQKVAELAAEIGFSGPSDMGKFMKAWMARYKGLAEGRDVQAALRNL